MSTQAVYDVLVACADAGLVRRIEPAGSAARFETRTGDNRHHLVCRSCGRTTPNDEAEVIFWGLCPECRNNHHTKETP